MPTPHEQKVKTIDDMVKSFKNTKLNSEHQKRVARELAEEGEE